MVPEAPGEPDVCPSADIRLAGVVKRYSRQRVLDDINLEIPAGTVHALVGANGAGKSTLGQILSGGTRPDEGEIHLGGRRVRWRGPRDARRDGVALIAQELALIPDLTVMENVFFGIEPQRAGLLARRQMQRKYAQLVEHWGFKLDRDQLVGRLRLADQQKVEILRAVASEARIVVMDEPTSSLTHVETDILHEMIAELRRAGRTVVYVSHFLDEVLDVSDTVTVLRNGRLVQSAPASLLSKEQLVASMFGDAETVETVELPTRSAAPVVLEVRGLARGTALRDVSLSIGEGEIVGLAGLIGSGRSELARAIFGVDRIEAGTIAVRAREHRIRSPRDAISAGIALVPESRKEDGLFMELSISSNVVFATLRSVATRLGLLRPGAERSIARRVIAELSIAAGGPATKVAALSGGNQQKVLFAKWMLREPDVLILDEPTRGVDVSSRAAIHRLIAELAGRGVAILLISSEFEEVIALSHRVLVIRDGALVGHFDRGAPLAQVMEAAFGVLATSTGAA